MTANEIKALRNIPAEYVADGTNLVTWHGDLVIVVSPNRRPLLYNPSTNEFQEVLFCPPSKPSVDKIIPLPHL